MTRNSFYKKSKWHEGDNQEDSLCRSLSIWDAAERKYCLEDVYTRTYRQLSSFYRDVYVSPGGRDRGDASCSCS